MGSIGVLERGEFKIVTHDIPVRSCIFFEKKKKSICHTRSISSEMAEMICKKSD